MVIKNFKRFAAILILLAVTQACAYSYTKANSDMANTYVAPCFKSPNGLKYCNANGGRYFYDEGTNKFWMALSHVNQYMYITDVRYAEYNPKTKTVNWNTPSSLSVALTNISILSGAMAGDTKGLISVNTVKTVEQVKSQQKNAQEQTKKADAAKQKAEAEKQNQLKLSHQKALTKAKEDGTLTSCKKLYWRYMLNPVNMVTLQNQQPYKNIEGTDRTYCQLKDGSTAMLQFEDKTDMTYGIKYRGLKLMDFTGKTKYYPWD